MHRAAPSETVHIESKALWDMVNVLSRRVMHWAKGFNAALAKAFANCQAYQGDLQVHCNLGSRTPLFTNNSVHEPFFRAKTSRMANGVSDYEHASWQAESIGAGVSVAG
jgi:hypothetical protein